ncbi:MAG: ATP-binding protein [Bacteroidales bacterium]|nr:ATP-binding protein [Bacteroidales bacterium]MDD4475975.1 ATP-binding protein [Eubacteriales bacterium]
MKKNPFVLTPYESKEYFCDREQELSMLMDFVSNGRNVTLLSPRRMGKTGLIFRLFDEMSTKQSDVQCIYLDIFATDSLESFVKVLASAVSSVFSQNTKIGRQFLDYLKHLRPLISYDPISGVPQISVTYQTENEKEQTLKGILDFIDSRGVKVLLAIDEFQQIREYKNVCFEALLRGYIQMMKNTNFIFCGSKRKMMLDMFSNPRSPFYSSTVIFPLDSVNKESYKSFITALFAKDSRTIDDDAVEYILDWTRLHTFYTQSLCNMIYSEGSSHITMKEVDSAIAMILKLNEPIFFQYRELLTSGQWQYLEAVAKEGVITQPTAGKFLMKYKIGTPANSRRLLSSLLDKELILSTTTQEGTSYRVYDVFMEKWMGR